METTDGKLINLVENTIGASAPDIADSIFAIVQQGVFQKRVECLIQWVSVELNLGLQL